MKPSWIRSFCFSLGMIAATVIWAPLSLLTFALPFPRRFQFITRWSTFVLWWLRLTCGIRHAVEGLENVPQQPSVVLSQHQSTWETLYLAQIFRPQVWVMKRELLWVPFFGWALALLNPVAIDRRAGRSAIRQVLKQGSERLYQGSHVVVFPEGTRVAPGQRRRHASGGAMLAIHCGCAVVPVAHNAGRYWPRRGFLKRPGTIRVVIGKPISSLGYPAEVLRAEVEAWMERTSARIDGPQAAATSAQGAASHHHREAQGTEV